MSIFLTSDRPVITVMLKSRKIPELLEEIESAQEQGAEAYGFQIELLRPEDRTRQNFRDIFQSMGDRPAYITNYTRGNVHPIPQSDEELAEEMLVALECGGKLCDVRGDMYCRSTYEITTDEKAIEKQKDFIREIHRMGGEVLMSSHVLEFAGKDRVLEIAKMHQERGTDISKIVTMADSEKELFENFEINLLLQRELAIRSLFLCNGSHCYKHRRLGPMLGSCMFLTKENSRNPEPQPYIIEAQKILADAGYSIVM